ncbi:MAG TPA: hypothetical protein VLW45_08320 [Pelomicrobium sp.]|nr:hypothetical protein [Pelomicrobium sp.]
MARSTSGRQPRPWTDTEVRSLRDFVNGGMPAQNIAERLRRSRYSIYSKASALNLSLRPSARPRTRR